VAFVGKKLKGFKRFVLYAEAVLYATEPEIRNTPQGMFLQNKTPDASGVLRMLCFFGNVCFLWITGSVFDRITEF
jgi:hypothetical protein